MSCDDVSTGCVLALLLRLLDLERLVLGLDMLLLSLPATATAAAGRVAALLRVPPGVLTPDPARLAPMLQESVGGVLAASVLMRLYASPTCTRLGHASTASAWLMALADSTSC
jgi:hypothetical protein